MQYSHYADVIAAALGVDVEKGLSGDEAAKRLKRDGTNTLEQKSEAAWRQILFAQFSSIVVWLLAAAAFVAWLTNGALETYGERSHSRTIALLTLSAVQLGNLNN